MVGYETGNAIRRKRSGCNIVGRTFLPERTGNTGERQGPLPMVRNIIAATPLFAAAAGLGVIGVLMVLAAQQSVEVGCFILSRKD